MEPGDLVEPGDSVEPGSGAVVRVVCVAFNPGAEITQFAQTLESATSHRYELVIVNNGEWCAEADALARAGRAHLVRHPGGNVGYGTAANFGADVELGPYAAESPWLVVSNTDIEWRPGSLDVLLAAGEALPRSGALGPRILNQDGSTYPSARSLPSLTTGAGHALFSRVWPRNPWTERYRQGERAARAGRPVPVGWLSGACLLLRRAAFQEVRGFDERYFMFFEDTDLGDRLGAAGWDNIYVPAAQVVHLQGTSWKQAPAPMIRAHHASARQFLFDRWHHWWQAPIRVALAVGLAVRERVAVVVANREHRRHQDQSEPMARPELSPVDKEQ